VAKRIKAVNTVANEGGKLVGYNTDCQGALEALEEKVDLKGKRVILLGAGGAARAIGFGLKERGCQIVILNRSPDRARELVKDLGCLQRPLSMIDDLEADVIVNATSLGMSPHEGESPLPGNVLKEGMTVMDIVYRPVRTRLLREAAELGCRTIDGLEMLARQGAAQIEIWTGRGPDLQEIREDLLRALKGESPSASLPAGGDRTVAPKGGME